LKIQTLAGMTAVIIDNNEADMNDLSFRLKELNHDIIIHKRFRTIESFKEFWKNDKSRTDIVFADITIDKGNIFEQLDIPNLHSNVIITTRKKEFAVQAFRHNVTDFLIKPVQQKDLIESISKAKKLMQLDERHTITNYKTQFQISIGKQIVNIKTEEIDFIESCNKMTYIHLHGNKKLPSVMPLLKLENILDPDYFFRANRQLIFHFDAIQSIEKSKSSKYLVTLKADEHKVISLSEERSKAFRKWIDR